MPGLVRSVKIEIVDAFQEGFAPTKQVGDEAQRRLDALLRRPYQDNVVQLQQHAKLMTELAALNVPGTHKYLALPVVREIAAKMDQNISKIYTALNEKKSLQQGMRAEENPDQVISPQIRRKI